MRLGRLNPHIMPVIVWLSAVVCVVVLFRNRSQKFQVMGITQGKIHRVSAPVDSRLKTVAVELFEDVIKGQILATLDETLLNAQIATIHAEIENLTAQLLSIQDTMLAEEANLKTDLAASQRRYNVDVENARLVILEQKTLIETDKVMLEDLALEVKIASELLEKDAIPPYELQKAQTLYNAMAKKIELSEQTLAQAEQDYEQARHRRDEYAKRQTAHPSIDNTLEPIRKQIAVQEGLINELAVQREALKITSPADGKVVQIQVNSNWIASLRPGEDVVRKPGEFVLAGEPLLVIAEKEPTAIVAYVSQEQLSEVKETKVVQIIKSTAPAKIAQSQVVNLGPTMEIMPQRLWQNPSVAQWGRPVVIKIPPGMDLLPGETVGIKGL